MPKASFGLVFCVLGLGKPFNKLEFHTAYCVTKREAIIKNLVKLCKMSKQWGGGQTRTGLVKCTNFLIAKLMPSPGPGLESILK